jgi:DNA repair protein RecN (Recombination protein N)
MLQELRIRNFAIIDQLELSFCEGFNVLTGETGTGKSIILNAVQLLLGEKASEDLVRSSEEQASVEALFDVSHCRGLQDLLKSKRGNTEKEKDDLLLVHRTILRSGRGKSFLDGDLATLAMISEVCGNLMSICGQHEHHSLQKVETHIDILDEFGGLFAARLEFQKRFEKFASLSEEIRRIGAEREKRMRDRELMSFQWKEIESARLEIGEEEALREEQSVLTHAKKLMEYSSFCQESLYSEKGSVIERIQTIIAQGRGATSIDPSLSHLLKSLESTLIQLEDVALAMRDYSRRIDINPKRLGEIEARLEEVGLLKRKYGPGIKDVLLFKERIGKELKSAASEDESLVHLGREAELLEGEVAALAGNLSSERQRVAAELKKSVEKELGSLGMKRTCFEVVFDRIGLSSRGMDRVEFLLSPNVGEDLKPLAKIASGGELSRIMLAVKRILAKVGGRQVLIFDEIDSGIGGAVAEVVGRKLKDLARHHQVICITHLPQIACFADQHYVVKKEMRGGRTITLVEALKRDGVIEEIARMLGGVKVTEKTRAHAKEMIENAGRP